MKVVCGILLTVILIVGGSNYANALKDMEQVKREVMASNTNAMGDGKTLGDAASLGFVGSLQQPYGRYPNYAGLGLQNAGPGFMLNGVGFGGPTQFAGSIPGLTPGFAGAGLPAGAVPYGMNYEMYPGNGVATNFMFGNAYPATIPPYPNAGQPPTAPFTFSQLQGFNQQPGQLPAKSQFSQQQQQSQFAAPQLQQIPAYPGYYPQFGYSPAYKSYQYSIGTI